MPPKQQSKARPSRVGNLSYQQIRFCTEYALSTDGNATRAAIRAGYTAQTAAKQAARFLKNPRIMAEIARIREKLPEQTGVTGDNIIQELAAIAFSNIGDFLRTSQTLEAVQANNENVLPANGMRTEFEIADLTAMTRKKLAAVGEVIFGRDGQVRIRMHDKLGALDRLSRIYGLYNQAQAEDPGDGPQLSELERAQRLVRLFARSGEGGGGPTISTGYSRGPVAPSGEHGEPE